MTRLMAGLLSLVCCLTLSSARVGGEEEPSALAPMLERFLARSDAPLTQYRARRVIEGHNKRFNKHAAIEAITELTADGDFTYIIVSETGSDYVLDKVLRPMLETEKEVFESGDPSRSALTPANYELAAGGPVEPGLVKLLAKARRKDISLIDGAVYVTSDDADLVRIEGRLAKNPSFWTTRVNIVRRYDRIAGVRVPISLDSTAQVRFAGESTLSMTYEYEMVNGVALTRAPVPSDRLPGLAGTAISLR